MKQPRLREPQKSEFQTGEDFADSVEFLKGRIRFLKDPTLPEFYRSIGGEKNLSRAWHGAIAKIKEMISETALASINACEATDPIYQLWSISRQRGNAVLNADVVRSLVSFDALRNIKFPNLTPNDLANFVRSIDSFMVMSGAPNQILEPNRRWFDLGIGVYNCKGKYVQIPPCLVYANGVAFVAVEALKEALDITDYASVIGRERLFHSTGSAALPGIARRGAILSSARAKECGEEILTGEFISFPKRAADGGTESRSIGSILGHQFPSEGYAVARWFDEYPVHLGFPIAAIAQLTGRGEGELRIHLSEGTAMGEEVPIEKADLIHVNLRDMERIKQWVAQNTPNARVVSMEARDLITRSCRYAAGQGKKIDPKILPFRDEWEKALATRKVTI